MYSSNVVCPRAALPCCCNYKSHSSVFFVFLSEISVIFSNGRYIYKGGAGARLWGRGGFPRAHIQNLIVVAENILSCIGSGNPIFPAHDLGRGTLFFKKTRS